MHLKEHMVRAWASPKARAADGLSSESFGVW